MLQNSHYLQPGEMHKQVLETVYRTGHEVSGTKELLGQSFTMQAPVMQHLISARPGSNRRIGILEGLQLVAGWQMPRTMAKYGALGDFQDGEAYYGAYGPRIAPSLSLVCSRLHSEPRTRQAIATIWRAEDVHHIESKDVPCTLTIQFIIRDYRLHMIANMRSSDLWWGWTYDLVQFGLLQACMAEALGYDVGTLTISAGSLHVYERHYKDAVDWILDRKSSKYWMPDDPLWKDVSQWSPCLSHGSWGNQVKAARFMLSKISNKAFSESVFLTHSATAMLQLFERNANGASGGQIV